MCLERSLALKHKSWQESCFCQPFWLLALVVCSLRLIGLIVYSFIKSKMKLGTLFLHAAPGQTCHRQRDDRVKGEGNGLQKLNNLFTFLLLKLLGKCYLSEMAGPLRAGSVRLFIHSETGCHSGGYSEEKIFVL